MNGKDNVFSDILGNLSQQIREESDKQRQQSINQGKEIEEMFNTPTYDMAKKLEERKETKEEISVQEEAMSLEEAMEKLDNLIGLENVKQKVSQLIESLKGEKILAEKTDLKMSRPNLHMIFSGPPGTGKTEVARILANVLFALGFVKNNKLVETDRSGLVAAHAGGTAEKVMNKFKEAEGGILFIDEAYSLANGDQYGKEAIDTVIKAMEDRRDSEIVILAGYEAEMENLLRQNPGFKSRIPNRFDFKDYNALELSQIAQVMFESKGYEYGDIAEELATYISVNSVNGVLEGNGRTIRNIVEGIILQHKIRIGRLTSLEGVNIKEITKEDVKSAIAPKQTDRQGMDEMKEKAQKEMDSMIGIDKIKKEIEGFLNFSIIQSKKIKNGSNIPMPTLNMIFKGNSGTGKTEMSKKVALKLKAHGVLNNGQIKEVSRGDLIGSVIGETAQKVKNIMAQSVGGILVIDRIETLDSEDSYSKEAIEVLIQEMDKYKGKMSIIITGEGEKVEKFLAKNPVLLTKINKTIEFEDYTNEVLLEILKKELEEKLNLEIEKDIEEKILEKMVFISPIKENAHWVERFIENIQIAQCNRLISESSEKYEEYKKEDFEDAIDMM